MSYPFRSIPSSFLGQALRIDYSRENVVRTR